MLAGHMTLNADRTLSYGMKSSSDCKAEDWLYKTKSLLNARPSYSSSACRFHLKDDFAFHCETNFQNQLIPCPSCWCWDLLFTQESIRGLPHTSPLGCAFQEQQWVLQIQFIKYFKVLFKSIPSSIRKRCTILLSNNGFSTYLLVKFFI